MASRAVIADNATVGTGLSAVVGRFPFRMLTSKARHYALATRRASPTIGAGYGA